MAISVGDNVGTPVYMEINDAYGFVRHYGQAQGIDNLWQILSAMESDWDGLDHIDRSAYKTVKRELEKAVKESQ